MAIVERLKFLLVEKCCCGCSLRTGAILVAVLYTVWELFEIAMRAGGMVLQSQSDDVTVTFGGAVVPPPADDGAADAEAADASPYGVAEGIGFAINAITIIFNILLLIGTLTTKPGLLVPWLVVEGIFVALALVLIPLAVVVMFVLGYHWLDSIIWIIVLIKAGIIACCYRVVFSLYVKMTARGEVVELAEKAKEELLNA